MIDKIKKVLSNRYAQISCFLLAAGAFVSMTPICHAQTGPTDFSATGTETILSNAITVPSAVLAWGIPIVLGIVLGIWAIFFLVGKMRKHTK